VRSVQASFWRETSLLGSGFNLPDQLGQMLSDQADPDSAWTLQIRKGSDPTRLQRKRQGLLRNLIEMLIKQGQQIAIYCITEEAQSKVQIGQAHPSYAARQLAQRLNELCDFIFNLGIQSHRHERTNPIREHVKVSLKLSSRYR